MTISQPRASRWSRSPRWTPTCGGDAGRAPSPARQDRADRERELRLRRRHGGAGQLAHEQVRRGPARQALLRRLRVRRHRRDDSPRSARWRCIPGVRARQRPAALGRAGQHGRLLQRAPARRPDHGHEPGPWRPSHPRDGPQLQRQASTRSMRTASGRTPSGSITTSMEAQAQARSARSSSWAARARTRGCGTSSAWRTSRTRSARCCSSTWPTSPGSSRPASIQVPSPTRTS